MNTKTDSKSIYPFYPAHPCKNSPSCIFVKKIRILKGTNMAIDISTLWDHSNPELSEQRFRTALETANADESLILHTQIARTFGIRKDFAQAQRVLAAIEPQISESGAEAQARYSLELGRTLSSTTHSPESQTDEVKAQARASYMHAFEVAKTAKLDDLVIDALHMMAMVDSAPADQLKWGLKALEVLEASSQPAAKKWEGSLRNNVGYALHLLGRYEEALSQFKLALAARELFGNPRTVRIAFWMIAWTYRALGRIEEAIEIQLRLEREWEADGEPDPYVYEELEHLFRLQNDDERADYYAALHRTALNSSRSA